MTRSERKLPLLALQMHLVSERLHVASVEESMQFETHCGRLTTAWATMVEMKIEKIAKSEKDVEKFHMTSGTAVR